MILQTRRLIPETIFFLPFCSTQTQDENQSTVLTSVRPHILEVSANVLCDDVDGLTMTSTGDDGRCVAMCRVELKDGPVGGVEEGGVDSSLEEERFAACGVSVTRKWSLC